MLCNSTKCQQNFGENWTSSFDDLVTFSNSTLLLFTTCFLEFLYYCINKYALKTLYLLCVKVYNS